MWFGVSWWPWPSYWTFPLTSHLWNERMSLLTSTKVLLWKHFTNAKRTLKRDGSIFIPEFSNQEMETTQRNGWDFSWVPHCGILGAKQEWASSRVWEVDRDSVGAWVNRPWCGPSHRGRSLKTTADTDRMLNAVSHSLHFPTSPTQQLLQIPTSIVSQYGPADGLSYQFLRVTFHRPKPYQVHSVWSIHCENQYLHTWGIYVWLLLLWSLYSNWGNDKLDEESSIFKVPSTWVLSQATWAKLSSACSFEMILDWYSTSTRHNSFYFWEVLYSNSLAWQCLWNPGLQSLQSNEDCIHPQKWPGSLQNFTKNFSPAVRVQPSSAAVGCFWILPLQIWFENFPFFSELVIPEREGKYHPKPSKGQKKPKAQNKIQDKDVKI